MQIRPISFDSYKSVIKLWKDAKLSFRPNGRDSPEEMKKQFEQDSDIILGAFENGDLIGVIFGSDDGRKGWINRLAVHPDHRGKKIAHSLIESLENALKKRGRKIICTLIEDWNESSFSLFNKMGYVKHDDIIYLSKRESEDI
jgi:GNAT superfamily N-acetyltransferase